MHEPQAIFDFLKENLEKVLSFHYDDRPMDDSIYDLHQYWIRFLHDFYFKVTHIGERKKVAQIAKRDPVILFSNHAITLEAAFIGYYFFIHNLGKIGTLVYPEAFKIPLIREFFRSAQCVPISVKSGIETLKKRHILIFPEGMDFIQGLTQSHQLSKFHRGFLRITKGYLEATGKKSVSLVPVAHVGIEDSLKFWVIKNEEFLNQYIRPLANYPFLIIPKVPFFLPSKIVMNWGAPIKITLKDLENEKKISQKATYFRQNLLNLRKEARNVRNRKGRDKD